MCECVDNEQRPEERNGAFSLAQRVRERRRAVGRLDGGLGSGVDGVGHLRRLIELIVRGWCRWIETGFDSFAGLGLLGGNREPDGGHGDRPNKRVVNGMQQNRREAAMARSISVVLLV